MYHLWLGRYYMEVDEPTVTEREAVHLLWHAKNPNADPSAMPPAEEFEQLLQQVRERALAIENASLQILEEKMRIRPSGGGSRVARFALVLTVIVVAVILLYTMSSYMYRK